MAQSDYDVLRKGAAQQATEDTIYRTMIKPMEDTAHDGHSAGQEWLDGLKDSFHLAFGEGSGIGVGEYFKRVKNEWTEKLSAICDWMMDSEHTLRRDDNIYVPADQKTLLGSDFSTLYNGTVRVNSMETENGTQKFMYAKTGYDTEMCSDHCSSVTPVSYDALSTEQKAVSEITLLTKAYVSVYDGSNKQDVIDSYGSVMNDYKKYCESNGVVWELVMADVSNELQTECYQYKEKGDAKNYSMAGLSHSLMLTAAGPEFQDALIPAAQQRGLSYDDTLSSDGKSLVDHKKLRSVAGDTIHSAISATANFAGSAWNHMRDACAALSDQIHEDQMSNGVAKTAASFSKGALNFMSGSLAQSRGAQADAIISFTEKDDSEVSLPV